MATIKAHLSNAELEARYKTAVDPIGKSHFHALWLLSCGYGLDEVAELLSFSPRWVRALLKRYNEGGDTPRVLGAKNAYHSDLHVLRCGAAMPILTVRHVTTYYYKQPAAFGEHRVERHVDSIA